MPFPRCRQYDPSNPPWIHAISRCVRRAFLCGVDRDGVDVEHRKRWVENRLRLIARSAAVDIAGYAVMSNHLHAVMRPRPDVARKWSAREVAVRWLSLWPREKLSDGTPVLPPEDQLAALCGNTLQIETWRERLADLSWIMKALKEDIARRANREDQCSGAFWEGRFKSVPLLDQAALTACMAYVDLNPIRAGVADRPERSRFTGAHARIRARQALRKAAGLRRAGDAAGARRVLAKAGIPQRRGDSDDDRRAGAGGAGGGHGDDGSWLTPVALCAAGGRPLSLDEYLTLLDATGRVVRSGKRGAIPPELAPILARLEIDVERWLTCMLGWRQFLGAAVGRLASRATEAGRRGLHWMQNRCALFAGESVSAPG